MIDDETTDEIDRLHVQLRALKETVAHHRVWTAMQVERLDAVLKWNRRFLHCGMIAISGFCGFICWAVFA